MNFKSIFEATDSHIKQIQSSIDKIDERPFNELFEGRERFLVKVHNPKLTKGLRSMGIKEKDINWEKRTYKPYNDKPIPLNRYLKSRIEQYQKQYDMDMSYHKLEDYIDDYKRNDGIELINHLISISKTKTFILKQLKDVNYPGNLNFILFLDNTQIVFIHPKKDIFYNFPKNQSLSSDDMENFIDILLSKINWLNSDMSHIDIINKENDHWIDIVWHAIKNLIEDSNDIHDKIKRMKNDFGRSLEAIKQLKQTIDQNNLFYYLLFSRHPIDVLRMSDHKGISSCHRLGGGRYENCAIADAKNDGGIVYLIKPADAKNIKEHLNAREVFYDKERKTGDITPIGRIRLRRFIDLKTGADFAVPTMLQHEQKYGHFTSEIYEDMLSYVRNHQSIYKNAPDPEYAEENIVMVGGEYSDEELSDLLDNFFGKTIYHSIKHKSGTTVDWNEEMIRLMNEYEAIHSYFRFDYRIYDGQSIKFEVNALLSINFKKIDPDIDYKKINMIKFNILFNKVIFQSIIRKQFRQTAESLSTESLYDLLSGVGSIYNFFTPSQLTSPMLTIPWSISNVYGDPNTIGEMLRTSIDNLYENDIKNIQNQITNMIKQNWSEFYKST